MITSGDEDMSMYRSESRPHRDMTMGERDGASRGHGKGEGL